MPPSEQGFLLQNSEVFREWRDATSSDFLYIHGDIDMTGTSEQLFYALDQQAIRGSQHESVLYFSFDRHDTNRNTLKDMLATFLSQMICHNAGVFNLWAELIFVQLNEEHGWTDGDLLQWFNHCSSIFFTRSAYLVIDRFDECPKAGRDSFVDCLYRRTASEETAWKVAITSRKAISLPQGPQEWRRIDQAMFMASDERLNTDNQVTNTTKVKNILLRYRPELVNEDAWLQSTNRISSGDTLIQSIIVEHSMSIPEWPRKLSTEEVFDLVENEDSGDELLMKILDSIFRKLAERFPVQTMLKWLLYSARPLSLWEITSVLYPDGLDNPRASPEPENVREFAQICETRLRGVIEIRDTRVRLRDPRLRALLTRAPSASSAYLWDDIDATQAAYDITKACLQFLSRPNVQQELQSIVEQVTLEEHTYVPVLGYMNFCSYAAYYWPRHAALIPTEMGLSSLLDEYKQTAMNSTWLKAYWCLQNPVTRSKQPSESVDSLLASLGLPYSDIGTWTSHSIGFTTERAAAQGQRELVETLLHRCEQSDSTIMDVLIAAASSGQEELVLHIFDHIKKTKSAASEKVQWPPCLLYRAAWLGMDKFTRALLEAGCSPEPGGPMAQKPRVSPLHQATRHGHIATMEALLSHGADTSFKTIRDRSILFTAAYSGQQEVFKTLFEKGKVNVTDVDEEKMTPLGYAASWGMTAAIKSLLRIGADPNDDKDLTSSDIEWLPLVEACGKGRTESVRILLDSDADPNQPGRGGVNTALRSAVVNSYPQIVRALLEKGADPNHPLLEWPILVELVDDTDVKPPMKVELINLLVAFGARVDAVDGRGRTALMHAIEARVDSAVASLLDLGANVDTEDDWKIRPLHLAAEKGSETILDLILAKKPDLDCLDSWGRTPLSRAIEFANLARILLEKGASPDLTEYRGFTPLALAAEFGHSETVEVLLAHGAQVNLRTDTDAGGWTAVCVAAENDRADIVKMLIDAGALLSLKSDQGSIALHVATLSTARVMLQHRKRFNIDEQNKFKMTALHRAIEWSKSTELAKLLIDSGANLNLRDRYLDTPLSVAAYMGNREVVKMLLNEEDCDKSLVSGPAISPLNRSIATNETLDIVKMLVDSGADVNKFGAIRAGPPLHAACENAKAGKEMTEYLLDHGADLHAQAGTRGFAISSAALYGTTDVIGLLLQRGATVNVKDAMGRTPMHMSCVGGALSFQEVYKAGGNHNLREKDNWGRTVFHWAAQHGLPGVLEDLVTELGTELINEPDLDGWTPLMWACWPGDLRGASSGPEKNDNEPEHCQARVFRILLENGARPDVTGKIGDSVWSLRDVALFNKMQKSCLQQVEDALTSITVQPTEPPETVDQKKGRIGAIRDELCDACYYVSGSGSELDNLVPSAKYSLFGTHIRNTDILLLARKPGDLSTSVPNATCASVINAIGGKISSTSPSARVPIGS